jgi:hypothetical protein
LTDAEQAELQDLRRRLREAVAAAASGTPGGPRQAIEALKAVMRDPANLELIRRDIALWVTERRTVPPRYPAFETIPNNRLRRSQVSWGGPAA